MKNHYRDGGLVISIIALIIITLGLSGFIFVHSPDAFWILAPIIVLVAGFATGKLVQITRKTSQYYGFIYEKIDQVNKLSLCSMPLGAVVTDANKKIILRTNCRPTHPAVLCVEPATGSCCPRGLPRNMK